MKIVILSGTMTVPATAEGDLGRTPFAHLLVFAIDRRLGGELFLTEPSSCTHVVRLVQGVPVKVKPGDGYALLGQLLVEAKAIDHTTLEGALTTRGLLGDVLLLAGCVDREVLERTVERQFLMRMVRLFALPPETTYRYVEGSNELAEWGGDPATIDPLAVVAAGLREHAARSAMMEGTLERLGDAPLRLHPQAAIARFKLDRDERRVVNRIEAGSVTFADLLEVKDLPRQVVRHVVYGLLLTRHLEVGGGLAPVGVDPPRKDSSPPGGPPSQALARVQLRAAVHRVGAAAPDQPGDGERAGVSVRKRRGPRSDDEPPSSRSEVLAAPKPPPLPPGQLYDMARARFEEKDYAGALEACALAVQGDPQPDYVALSVWIRASMPSPDVKALTVELDELLRAHEQHVAARFYRGVLRKRFGDSAGALRDLSRVLELDPGHAEAARLVEALGARSAPRANPGIFGRLFKR